jgi:hypothetical protein
MEDWNAEILGIKTKTTYLKSFKPMIPLLHYSFIPVGAKPLSFILFFLLPINR